MSDLKNILKDIGYFGVGAAAVILEAGGKAIKSLVRKGEEILRENQDTVDELKRKAKEAGEKIKDAAQKAAAKPEPAPEEVPTPEVEAPVVPDEVPSPAADAPVVPDAVYRTDEPTPAEDVPDVFVDDVIAEDDGKPEDTING